MSTMRYLSVCSGIEAASVAWEPLGWTPLAFSEIEPFPSAVLAHHWPDVPNLGDFTTIEREDLSSLPDVLIGGTPCQAFSVAGLRNSLEDERGNLTIEFVRLADRLDDGQLIVVWENVPGVLNTPDNAFGCFLGALVGCDTALQPPGKRWGNAGVVAGPTRVAAWRVLDAQYFGVAQRRRRVFVVASAREGFDPVSVLLERDGVRRDSPPSREPREGAAAGFECGPQGGRFTDLSPTLDTRAKDGPIRNQLGVGVCEVAHTLTKRYDSSEDGTGRGTPLVIASGHANAERCIDHSPTLRSMSNAASAPNGGGQVAIAFNWQNAGNEGYAFTEDATGPLDTSQTKVVFGTQSAVRRLTPRECERLQGFPDDWTMIPWRKNPAEDCPDGPRYKCCGNSMAVPVIRWIGERIERVVA